MVFKSRYSLLLVGVIVFTLGLTLTACVAAPGISSSASVTSSPSIAPASSLTATAAALSSTSSAPAPVGPGRPGGIGGGAVINSDSVITAKIQAVRSQSKGYPWELDILIQSSVDVGSLPNPTKDSVGKVVTVKTDQDMASFKVNDVVAGKVKYVGDVPKPGITLYIYEIVLIVPP